MSPGNADSASTVGAPVKLPPGNEPEELPPDQKPDELPPEITPTETPPPRPDPVHPPEQPPPELPPDRIPETPPLREVRGCEVHAPVRFAAIPPPHAPPSPASR